MFKKVKLILSTTILMFLLYMITIVSFGAGEIITVDDSLQKANIFIEENFNYRSFFEKLSLKDKPINNELAVIGNETFMNKPIFVYDTSVAGSIEATKFGNDTRREDSNHNLRALGFSFTDSPYANPQFHIDNVNYVRRWIKNPWDLPSESQGGITKQLSPDSDVVPLKYRTQWLEYQPETFASTYSVIKQWVKSDDFLPDKVEAKTYNHNRKFFNDYIEWPSEGVPPGLRTNPEDYIYIIQPPTYDSWGIGVAFYYYGGTGADNASNPNYYSYYQYFRYKPFSLLLNDLAAQFNPIPSSAVVGDNVLVGIKIKSTFDTKLQDVPFKWEITKKTDGTAVPVTFTGDATAKEGNMKEIPSVNDPEEGERMLYASFKMPDCDVKIKFEINKDGKSPEEKYLDNNVLDSGNAIKPVDRITTTGSAVDLDYNILTKEFPYPLVKTQAELILPRGSWNGNATGALNVNNETQNLLKNFTVDKKELQVDEPSEIIVREPIAHTKVQRSDFGDDPQNGNWLNPENPKVPVPRQGIVSFDGSVTRPYEYTDYYDKENNLSRTESGSTTAAFNSGSVTKTINAYIYNGKPVIAPKVFENKINNNDTNSLRKDFFWTSELYRFDVIRWMFDMYEDDSLHDSLLDKTPVNGQYQRNFTQQCSATLNWANVNTMEHDYKRSRDAAKSRDYRNSEYDKAVFASDADFRNVPYPIKSGYYFNPTGTYTFTVQTVTYKNTTADTKDHRDLVNAAINSFHYETDLMFINNNKEAVNIKNEPLPGRGAGYERRSAALTAQSPNGVDGAVMLNVLDRNDDESRYSKKVEELPHYEDDSRADDNHEFFKEILEGYSESGTFDSKDSYKYREYIKDGQHMYKITEKTTVTIEINPQNRNVYTHAQMTDGEYTVKAWMGDIKLSDMDSAYERLGTLKGISALDQITVSVKGSMYEDTN